jgi:hypothetical protein
MAPKIFVESIILKRMASSAGKKIWYCFSAIHGLQWSTTMAIHGDNLPRSSWEGWPQ